MRLFILLLILSGTALASGCVIVPSDYPAIGFYGPFPAVFVPQHHDRNVRARDYDDRDYDRRRYDEGGRLYRRYRDQRD